MYSSIMINIFLLVSFIINSNTSESAVLKARSRNSTFNIEEWNVLLFWTTLNSDDPIFGAKNIVDFDGFEDFEDQESPYSHVLDCQDKRCLVTVNREYLRQARAVLFSWNDFNKADLPDYRSSHQLWVLLNNNPIVRPLISSDVQMNFTVGKQFMMDFPILNGRILWNQGQLDTNGIKALQKHKKIPLFCYMCCQYMNQFEFGGPKIPDLRRPYILALVSELKGHNYGKCGSYKCYGDQTIDDCLKEHAKDYYFILTFSIYSCHNYIQPEVFFALKHGLVPVLSSRPPEGILPPNSYVDGSGLTPNELAQKLKAIIAHRDEYGKYLEWRKNGSAEAFDDIAQKHKMYCKICAQNELVRHRKFHRKSRDVHNISLQYSTEERCTVMNLGIYEK